METETIKQILQLLDCPAFSVREDTVTAANTQAEQRQIHVGMAVYDLLKDCRQEYESYRGGVLRLTLQLGGSTADATVSELDGQRIFRLESGSSQPRLQAMSLVAEMLRKPLSDIMPAVEELLRENPGEDSAEIRQMNRGLYEILRMVNHMSLAALDPGSFAPDEILNLDAFLEELVCKAAHFLESSGISLRYIGSDKPVYCRANARLIEQAVYSLLSNAAKFSEKGGEIIAKLSQKGERIYFCVEDSGCGIPSEVNGKVFSMYCREAGIEDGRYGLGLGMVLVQQAAAAHNGTVLMERIGGGGTRVTLVLDSQSRSELPLRSRTAVVDTTGGWDPALVCLSDVLPSSVYGQ